MTNLTEKRWRYRISDKVASDFRNAVDNEDYEEVKENIKRVYREINGFYPEEFDEDELEQKEIDVDSLDDDEDEIDFEISDMYDLLDNLNIWMPINELDESLLKEDSGEGWSEELAEATVLNDIEKLIYELKNARRGAYTKARTYSELADYISELSNDLSYFSERVRDFEDYDSDDEDFDESLNESAISECDKADKLKMQWDLEDDAQWEDEYVNEGTVKQGNRWVNKGKDGTHGSFKTKKAADAQRKAMYANGFKGESIDSPLVDAEYLNAVDKNTKTPLPEGKECGDVCQYDVSEYDDDVSDIKL